MKILVINKFWKPQGGADRYALWTVEALQQAGHEVCVFSMEDPENVAVTVPNAFISHVETRRMKLAAAPRTVARMFWSFEAQRKLRALIREQKPDVAHVHNLYSQMSPSVLPVLKAEGVPVVAHVHDYGMTSANYSLFDQKGIDRLGTFWSVIRRRGVKNSWIASAIAATVFALHRIMHVYERNITTMIFTTDFVKRLFHARGWEGDRGVILPYVVNMHGEDQKPQEDDGYALFVGRLHKTKGVDVLLEAVRAAGVPLKIVGDGPDRAQLERQASGMTQVMWMGRQSQEKVHELMRKARVVVVPSVWWEPFGMVAIEPQAVGTPVIASQTGGLQNLVVHGQTGYLVKPGDVQSLTHALESIFDDPAIAKKMGALGKRRFASVYDVETHVATLEKVYKEAIKKEAAH